MTIVITIFLPNVLIPFCSAHLPEPNIHKFLMLKMKLHIAMTVLNAGFNPVCIVAYKKPGEFDNGFSVI